MEACGEALGLALLTELPTQEPAVFPSHHGGFLGGEFGQQGQPERFAARLHEVLDAPAVPEE